MLPREQTAAALIATLGSEPQVVTAALSLLQKAGEAVERVALVHTGGRVVKDAVHRLGAALREAGVPCELHPIRAPGGGVFEDVETPSACDAAFGALYRAVWQAKRRGERLHLLLAGGRKTLTIYGMLTAQLLFGEEDRVWHLYSAGEFLESRRLYPQEGDEAQLIPIPLPLRSYLSLALTHLRQVDDPFAALAHIQELDLEEKHRQAESFLRQLSAAERRVVELLARRGLSDEEIAARCHLSARTVQNHLYSAYGKAARHWQMGQVSRAQLVALLAAYYSFAGAAQPGGSGNLSSKIE